MSEEINDKILKILYEQWFQNHIIGHKKSHFLENLDEYPENEIKKSLERMSDDYQIDINNSSQYKITESGIDEYEEKNQNITSEAIEMRTKILKILEPIYENDIDDSIKGEVIIKKFMSEDKNYIFAQVAYLEKCNHVKVQWAMGGFYSLKLTIHGKDFLDERSHDE